jgi:hypothetical protein
MGWPERPNMLAGGRLLAEDLDVQNDAIELLLSRGAMLIATHAGNGTATVASTNLARPAKANRYVKCIADVFYKATTGGDIKFDFLKPTGATLIRGSLFSLPASVDAASGDVYLGSEASNLQVLSAPGRTSSTDIMRAKLIASYLTSSTAGSFTLQYARASGTGTASDTQVMAGSTLHVEEYDGV